ncbi:MAG: hypothetical protein KGL39_54695 [Patescibacteria group bacterium]|nr:hypothetical protein [Patescibacteria group bacterium]
MAFVLNDFRNALQYGGARPSQFDMQIVWPATVDASLARLQFPFLCSVSQIPASTVGEIMVPYFGRELYYAGDRKFESLTVTIFNDEDYAIRHSLEDWLKQIQSHSTSVSAFQGGIATSGGVGTSYATRGIVRQLSRNEDGNGPQQRYIFEGMFPRNLSNIELNWNAFDQIEQYTVEFRYQWWVCETYQNGTW